jgi:hypothetical protein
MSLTVLIDCECGPSSVELIANLQQLFCATFQNLSTHRRLHLVKQNAAPIALPIGITDWPPGLPIVLPALPRTYRSGKQFIWVMSQTVGSLGPEGAVDIIYVPTVSRTIRCHAGGTSEAHTSPSFLEQLLAIFSLSKCRRALISHTNSGSFMDNPTAEECSHIYISGVGRIMHQSSFNSVDWQTLFKGKI